MLATVPFGRVVAPAPTLGAGAPLALVPALPRSASAPPSRPPTSPATRATATATPMRAPQPGPRRRVRLGAGRGGQRGVRRVRGPPAWTVGTRRRAVGASARRASGVRAGQSGTSGRLGCGDGSGLRRLAPTGCAERDLLGVLRPARRRQPRPAGSRRSAGSPDDSSCSGRTPRAPVVAAGLVLAGHGVDSARSPRDRRPRSGSADLGVGTCRGGPGTDGTEAGETTGVVASAGPAAPHGPPVRR